MMATGLMSAVTIMSDAARLTMKASPIIWSFFFAVRVVPITRKFPTVPVKANRPSRLTYGIAIAGCDVISAGSTSEAFGINGKSMVRLANTKHVKCVRSATVLITYFMK